MGSPHIIITASAIMNVEKARQAAWGHCALETIQLTQEEWLKRQIPDRSCVREIM
jgi:hypothetical protein